MKELSALVAIAILFAVAERATALEPMDLSRRTARWITVQVVTSAPGEAKPRLSEPVHAWYEVGSRPGERVITVPGPEVERVFLAERRPIEDSFSDFVWVFDATTGHVSSASFSGSLDEPVRIGPFQTRARVSITVVLSTRFSGGYRRQRRIAGRTVVGYCAELLRTDCTPAASAAYDPSSGWVRANGAVCATWRTFHTLAYTQLGWARFAEKEPHGKPIAPPQSFDVSPLGMGAAEAGEPTC